MLLWISISPVTRFLRKVDKADLMPNASVTPSDKNSSSVWLLEGPAEETSNYPKKKT